VVCLSREFEGRPRTTAGRGGYLREKTGQNGGDESGGGNTPLGHSARIYTYIHVCIHAYIYARTHMFTFRKSTYNGHDTGHNCHRQTNTHRARKTIQQSWTNTVNCLLTLQIFRNCTEWIIHEIWNQIIFKTNFLLVRMLMVVGNLLNNLIPVNMVPFWKTESFEVARWNWFLLFELRPWTSEP
jgi:hypothetical protein